MGELLDDYLLKMKTSLNEFQKEMKVKGTSLDKGSFFQWYLENNESVKNYAVILNIGANLGNKEDDSVAYKETFNKYVETMKLFDELYFDGSTFK